MVSLIETPTRLVVMGSEAEIDTLRERFRYHPSNYWHSDAYQLWKVTGGTKGWDGYRHPLVLKTPLAGEILRGRKDELLAICKMEGIPVNIDRCMVSPFPNMKVSDITDGLIHASFKLDENQKKAIVEWLRHGIGVANMAVNAGKTATFAAAAAYIKRHYPEARFLYFTPSERLVKQVFDWMVQFLPDWHITKYGGGKRDNTGKDMVVATQSMLAKHFKELDRTGWLKTFHALLLDESHHCQSPTAEQVILACVGYFRLGASDTTKEDDADKWNRIQGLCGPIRANVTSSQLIHSGRSAAPTLYLVDIPEWRGKFRHAELQAQPGSTAWTLIDDKWVKAKFLGPVYDLDKDGNVQYTTQRELRGDKFIKVRVEKTKKNLHLLSIGGKEYESPASLTLLDRRYDQAIMRFRERNELIVRWTKYYSDKGWPTVVVATRTPHVLILDALLQPVLGDKVRPLIGESTTVERDDAFAWFKTTPGAVLVASIIKEGISVNEMKAGVIADPVADWELAKQIVGRFMRQKAGDNTCYITWFIDNQHPRYLRNVRDVMDKLEGIEGFTFYHPVAGPETIDRANIHKGHL